MSDAQAKVALHFTWETTNNRSFTLDDVLRECHANQIDDPAPVVLLALGMLPKDGTYVDSNGTYVSLESLAMREADSLFMAATGSRIV